MTILSHPLTALVAALVLAGLGASGLLTDNSTLAVGLWITAGLVLLTAGVETAIRRRGRPTTVAAATNGSPTPKGDLDITIDDERVHQFKYKALLVECRVRIENLTDREKAIHGFGLRWQTAGQTSPRGDSEVMREKQRLEETHDPLPGRVDARQAVQGWLVAVFPHQPEGGIPECEVSVSDERGDEYVRRQPARPRQTYEKGPEGK